MTKTNPLLFNSGGPRGTVAVNSSSLAFVLLLTFNCSSCIFSGLQARGGGIGFFFDAILVSVNSAKGLTIA
jgi:hypothetical protein